MKTLEQLIKEGNGIAAGTPDYAKDGKIYDCYGRQLETVKMAEERIRIEHLWAYCLYRSKVVNPIIDPITGDAMIDSGEVLTVEHINEMMEIGFCLDIVYMRHIGIGL